MSLQSSQQYDHLTALGSVIYNRSATKLPSNVFELFTENAEPIQKKPDCLTRKVKGATPEELAVREIIGTQLHRHVISPTMGRTNDFNNLLVTSIGAIANSFLRDRLGFSLRLGSTCVVNAEQASTIAFAMSEILINALKYARPSGGRIAIEIDCSRGENGRTVLEIYDDGVGLPPGFEECFDAGQGIMLTRFKLQNIGASVDLRSNDLGVRFRIELPPPLAQNAICKTPITRLYSRLRRFA